MVPVAQETTANTVRLPYSFSRRFSLVAWCEASLEILHVHPLSLSVLQELQRGLNAPFTLRQIDEAEFEQRLNAVWQRDSSEARQLMEDLGSAEDFFTLAEELPETEDLLESDDNAPIIKLINAMLAEAIKEGASDIHIETFEKSLVIRFRVDGTLHEMLRPGRKLASLLVSRIKVMARLDIAEKRVQQLIALISRLDVPAYRAELIAESLWEFIDEDRSVQTRLGREDSEYLARSVPFYAANKPLADISEMRVVQGMDAGLYQKLKPLVCALPMIRQQININTLDVTQSVILEALFDPWLSPVQARALLQQRPAKGWEDVDQFLAQPLLADVDERTKKQLKTVLSVDSNYFWLRSDITVNEIELTMNSLIVRMGPQHFSVLWHQTGESE